MATLVKLRGMERDSASTDVGALSRGFRVKSAFGPIYPKGVKAFLSIGTANAEVLYTAKKGGTWANTKVKVAHLGGTSKTLGVTVSFGTDGVATVNVQLGTNGGGTVTSTANQVVAAVNAYPTASELVTASKGAGTGVTIAVAGSATALASGTNVGGAELNYSKLVSGKEILVDISDRQVQKLLRRNSYRVLVLDVT